MLDVVDKVAMVGINIWLKNNKNKNNNFLHRVYYIHYVREKCVIYIYYSLKSK